MLQFLVSQLRKTMREMKFISTKKCQPQSSSTVWFFIGKKQHVPVYRNLCRLDYVRATKIIVIVPWATVTYVTWPSHLGNRARSCWRVLIKMASLNHTCSRCMLQQPGQNLNVEHSFQEFKHHEGETESFWHIFVIVEAGVLKFMNIFKSYFLYSQDFQDLFKKCWGFWKQLNRLRWAI